MGDDIEVTPEMIAAGRRAYDVSSKPWDSEEAIFRAIYVAMEVARRDASPGFGMAPLKPEGARWVGDEFDGHAVTETGERWPGS